MRLAEVRLSGEISPMALLAAWAERGVAAAGVDVSRRALNDGSYHFFFDGLDEVSNALQDQVAALINMLAYELPQHAFTVSSRPLPLLEFLKLDSPESIDLRHITLAPDEAWRELYLAERGVTLKRLAAELQVSSAYLSALEHGHRGTPSAGLVHQVNEFFGLIWDEADDLAHLLGPEPSPSDLGIVGIWFLFGLVGVVMYVVSVIISCGQRFVYAAGTEALIHGPSVPPYSHNYVDQNDPNFGPTTTIYCVSANGSGTDCTAPPCKTGNDPWGDPYCELTLHPNHAATGPSGRLACPAR